MKLFYIVLITIIVLITSTTTPPAQAQQKHRIVVSSCYGPGLYGNRMANGKTLKRKTIGVAHRSLPFGTRIVIRFKSRVVVATVTDRGPYNYSRSMDITEQTARRLGFRSCTRFGVKKVRVTIRKR